MSKIKSVMVFANGNVAVFNTQGKQVSKHQGSCLNYDYIQRVVDLCLEHNIQPEIQGDGPPYDFRTELIRRLAHAKRGGQQ